MLQRDVHRQPSLQDLTKGIYCIEALDSTKPSEPMEHAPHDPWQHVMIQQVIQVSKKDLVVQHICPVE